MDFKKFTIELVRLLLGNAWNRTGSALAIIGATALTGWIDQLIAHLVGFKLEQSAPWIGFAVMLTGVVMLAFGIRKDVAQARPPHPHDVELINQFRGRVTDDVIDFLSVHDFGIPWRRDRLEGIAEIAEGWRTARHEFQNKELNDALTTVKTSANQLEVLLAYRSFPARDNAEMQTVKTDEDYRIGTQPATVRTIAEINGAASILLSDINELERLARSHIPV